ncbi:hypothetical protein AVEN_59242-1 [Araneus ventricosus]|uniref:Uncharacterized protein n=1 Tax=Araneus ventricosus TaxID=182803 RepID=A0A4Y2CZF7_ARAVE|nr:hypothetical protein AVEN_59242-1 [Araneus ventricosus]
MYTPPCFHRTPQRTKKLFLILVNSHRLIDKSQNGRTNFCRAPPSPCVALSQSADPLPKISPTDSGWMNGFPPPPRQPRQRFFFLPSLHSSFPAAPFLKNAIFRLFDSSFPTSHAIFHPGRRNTLECSIKTKLTLQTARPDHRLCPRDKTLMHRRNNLASPQQTTK